MMLKVEMRRLRLRPEVSVCPLARIFCQRPCVRVYCLATSSGGLFVIVRIAHHRCAQLG